MFVCVCVCVFTTKGQWPIKAMVSKRGQYNGVWVLKHK